MTTSATIIQRVWNYCNVLRAGLPDLHPARTEVFYCNVVQ